MSQEATSAHLPPPPVKWAQRQKELYVTIEVENCQIEDLSIDAQRLHFKGKGGREHREFECEIAFYEPVERYRSTPNRRQIELIIEKSEKSWWPRLTKQKGRVPFIGIDFNKWLDEDEILEEEEKKKKAEADAEDPFSGMNLEWTDRGMEQMVESMDKRPPDLGDYEVDDDEDVPDLERPSPPKTMSSKPPPFENELDTIDE